MQMKTGVFGLHKKPTLAIPSGGWQGVGGQWAASLHAATAALGIL